MVKRFEVDKITDPSFLKSLSYDELNQLCSDIREFIIDKVSKTGGHLASNLGVVELTVAMHYVFDSPKDKFLFDVSHQCYTHKILTGRADKFDMLRKYNGISGFTKLEESEHDVWESGHSSTSLSAALGMAIARDHNDEHYNILPLIGDGSLESGMAMEALNNIGSLGKKMVIIFNDNGMSISKHESALEHSLGVLRRSKSYLNLKDLFVTKTNNTNFGESVQNVLRDVKDGLKHTIWGDNVFSVYNIDYLGPIDGHNMKELVEALEMAKRKNRPIVVHVVTKKGKGYGPAENDEKGIWHGVGPFNKLTGELLSKNKPGYKSNSEIVSNCLLELAKNDKDIFAITPAMLVGSKLEKFKKELPDRCIDTGITEEHATTLAGSMALSGLKPYLFLYSTFMQRSYDQINHDITRMNLPVKILLDRAGLVGEDGNTHHGVFDISILESLPNIILSQPSDFKETYDLLYTMNNTNKAFVMRYAKGSNKVIDDYSPKMIEIGSWVLEKFANESPKAVVLTYGNSFSELKAYYSNNHANIWLVNARFFKPLDYKMLDMLADLKVKLFVHSTDILSGSLGTFILQYYNSINRSVDIKCYGIDDKYVTYGNNDQLYKDENIDIETLISDVKDYLCD